MTKHYCNRYSCGVLQGERNQTNHKKLDHDQHPPGNGAINEYGALKVEQDRKEVEKVENELEEKIEEMHLEKEDLSCDFSPIGKCLSVIT